MPNDEIINVRYMVDDVEESIAFYTKLLGFELLTSASPAFADVKRGNLRLLLSGPKSSAGRPMPDGAKPGPGGWNRIHFIVDDLDTEVERLRDAGAGVPQRRRRRTRRQADPAPGPVRQRRRALSAGQSLNATAGPTDRRVDDPPAILDQRRDRRRNAPTTARRERRRGHRCRIDDRRRRLRRLGTGGRRGRSGLLVGLAIAVDRRVLQRHLVGPARRGAPRVGRHLRVRSPATRRRLGSSRRMGFRRRQDRVVCRDGADRRRLSVARA